MNCPFVEADLASSFSIHIMWRKKNGLGVWIRRRPDLPSAVADAAALNSKLMTPATATRDPPFRRELSRARSRLYGYLR